jgi:hypothetical protein
MKSSRGKQTAPVEGLNRAGSIQTMHLLPRRENRRFGKCGRARTLPSEETLQVPVGVQTPSLTPISDSETGNVLRLAMSAIDSDPLVPVSRGGETFQQASFDGRPQSGHET